MSDFLLLFFNPVWTCQRFKDCVAAVADLLLDWARRPTVIASGLDFFRKGQDGLVTWDSLRCLCVFLWV